MFPAGRIGPEPGPLGRPSERRGARARRRRRGAVRGGGGARLVPIRAFPAVRPGPGPPGQSRAADWHRRPACDRGSGGCAACQRSGPRPGSCRRCAGPGIRAACRRRAARLAAGASRPGIAGAARLLSPGCGHCDALLPQVAGWQHQHRDRLTVALATRRSAGQKAATPQTHGLRDELLQANREIAEAYQVNGTPSAVLIAASGKIASPPAAGAQAITQLIHSATTSGLPAVPAAARAASAAGPSSQDKPGPAAGAAAPGLARTHPPVPAQRGRRVHGQPVPIPHREP